MNDIMMDLFLFFYDNVYVPFVNSLGLMPFLSAEVYVGATAVSLAQIISTVITLVFAGVVIYFPYKLISYPFKLFSPKNWR